jgi:hypothetical protein
VKPVSKEESSNRHSPRLRKKSSSPSSPIQKKRIHARQHAQRGVRAAHPIIPTPKQRALQGLLTKTKVQESLGHSNRKRIQRR